ncbi:hypothetical protein ACIA5C_40020 [Actinoplanes sp. NPDC051343]|uniref:hypothetical protein n=1 Tax=Actinoplanes sp. NPDC051343 TaxID=3363906 RepID=UPI0037895018
MAEQPLIGFIGKGGTPALSKPPPAALVNCVKPTPLHFDIACSVLAKCSAISPVEPGAFRQALRTPEWQFNSTRGEWPNPGTGRRQSRQGSIAAAAPGEDDTAASGTAVLPTPGHRLTAMPTAVMPRRAKAGG